MKSVKIINNAEKGNPTVRMPTVDPKISIKNTSRKFSLPSCYCVCLPPLLLLILEIDAPCQSSLLTFLAEMGCTNAYYTEPKSCSISICSLS